MTATSRAILLLVVICTLVEPKSAQNSNASRGMPTSVDQAVPDWVKRGMPSAGHAALAPLVGSWSVELQIYGTVGRSPDLPPIVSNDIRTARLWVAQMDSTLRTPPKERLMDSRTGGGAGSATATSTVAMNGLLSPRGFR